MLLSYIASATTKVAKKQANRTMCFSRTMSSSLINNQGQNGAIRVCRQHYPRRFSSNSAFGMQSLQTAANRKLRGQSLLTEINQKMIKKKRYMSSVTTGSDNAYYRIFDLSPLSNLKLALGAILILQVTSGSTAESKPFYDYRFITKKDPDDVASFYGGEELMELFCVLPWMTHIMLRGAVFDDEGNVDAVGFPGRMKIQMVFSDEYDEEAEQTSWFNKRERFKDTLFGITMWDMVINYGFTRLPDGRFEVYHQAEYFKGYSPPISLVMRLVFRIHARYMVWAAEHHINHYAFTSENDAQEKLEEESRKFALLRLMKESFFGDLKAMAIGSNKETDSFLTKDEDDEFEEDEEDEEEVQRVEEVEIKPKLKPPVVILSRRSTVSSVVNLKQRIDDDIAFDKTVSLNQLKITEDALISTRTTGKAYGDAYQMATISALQKRKTRVARRRSNILVPDVAVGKPNVAVGKPNTDEEQSAA